MASEGIARFRLSVWRPAQLGRPLDYALTERPEIGKAIAFDSNRLQEEVYHWYPGQEDVWGCIEPPALSSELRDLFVEGFAPSRSPEQRSMANFQRAVEQLGIALNKNGVSTWADLMQTVRIGRNESANLRGNTALSLWHHMEWIIRVFGSVPGASVTIR
jgi:hypothetical protein